MTPVTPGLNASSSGINGVRLSIAVDCVSRFFNRSLLRDPPPELLVSPDVAPSSSFELYNLEIFTFDLELFFDT